MLALLVLCIPAACIVAGVLHRRFRVPAAGDSACWSCGYDRAGLGDGALCPECGRPPGPSGMGAVHAPVRPFIWCNAAALAAPAMCLGLSVVYGVVALFTWALAAGLLSAFAGAGRGSVPRAWAAALTWAPLAGLPAMALYVLTLSGLLFTGQIEPGEYGPGFDVAMASVVGGPLLAVNLGCWLYVAVGLVALCTARPEHQRR